MCPGLDPPLAHVADCSRMTSKPEVIPETESLPYLQKSQRRSRSVSCLHVVLASLLVCAKCAQQACTRLLRTAPISWQRQLRVSETAGAFRSCKSVASHSKSADLRVLGVQLPLPAPN